MRRSTKIACIFAMLLVSPPISATILSQYPNVLTLENWPTEWNALPSLDDGVNAGVLGRLDFVGDAFNSGVYWSVDQSYVYFRVRVNVSTIASVNTYADTVFVLIDRVGWGNEDGRPDYGFAWDSKGSIKTEHGLELQVPPGSLPATWAGLKMTDRDGNPAAKLSPPDFNLTGDGFIRTVDSQATTNFGDTTFIDFAVSWPYLSSMYSGAPLTTLQPGQDWRIALASLTGDTDHGDLNADVAGGAALSSNPATSGWSSPFLLSNSAEVPETGTLVLCGLGLILTGGLEWRRWHTRS